MREDILEKVYEDSNSVPARILDAAEEVFAEHGYTGASTREIARRAGVPFGAVHYYWGSKQILKRFVIKRLVDQSRKSISISILPDVSVEEIIETILDALFELLISNRNAMRLWLHGLLEPKDEEVDVLFRDLTDYGATLLEKFQPQQSINRKVAINTLGLAVLGTIADEHAQQRLFGDTAYNSTSVKVQLRDELYRVAKAILLSK